MTLFRLCLSGALAVSALTGCGSSKVTDASATPPDVGPIVAVVSPGSVVIAVGGTAQLTAYDDAHAAIASRYVTWHSSDAAIGTVSDNGLVTGINPGFVTILAASVMEPTVRGAAAVTVGHASIEGGVTVAAIQTMNATGEWVPANLASIAGTVNVVAEVATDNSAATNVILSLKSGTDSLMQAATIPVASSKNSTTMTFTLNTAQKNDMGARILNNGTATLTIKASTNSTPPQSAATSITFTLANPETG